MIRLVKQAMQADTGAFLDLMEQNSSGMYKVARAILKNDEDVADAMQDTILICFEKIHTLKKPEYFKTWLIRILINECNRILQHYREINLPEQMPEVGRKDQSLAEFEFKEMLECVDEKYRVVLVLYYIQGLKIQEIAKLMDMNENTVKTRLSRGREQIREEYMGDKYEQKKESSNGGINSMTGGMKDERKDQFIFSKRYTIG